MACNEPNACKLQGRWCHLHGVGRHADTCQHAGKLAVAARRHDVVVAELVRSAIRGGRGGQDAEEVVGSAANRKHMLACVESLAG